MIDANFLIPGFPVVLGEAGVVEFTKDGRVYRLLRIGDDVVVMHQRGVPREDFELVISNFSRGGEVFDVVGTTHLGVTLSALGTSKFELFDKLF